jgi:hypothetical protein
MSRPPSLVLPIAGDSWNEEGRAGLRLRPEFGNEVAHVPSARRLRTRRPCSVDTSARNPFHFTSNDQSPRVGMEPERAGMG